MSHPFKTFGATGKFPRGKLHESDEGELQMGITVRNGTVVLVFGKPVAWFGMPPSKARELARLLIERSDEATRAQ